MVAARSRGHGAARRMFFRAVADMVPAFSAGLSGKMLRQGLRFVCTSARHECLPPRSRFLPAMAKSSVRRARTPHRGDAHNARLTPLHRGGKDRELSIMPQGKSHLSAAGLNLPILRLMRKSECAGAINVANCPRRGKPRGQPKGVSAGVSPPHDIMLPQYIAKRFS